MVQGKKTGIVILNYKDAETTEKLCRRIETYCSVDRIVIVDNQSPDDSYERLLKLASPKVDVIRSDRNGGYSYGNNVGAFYLMDRYGVDLLFIANPDVEFEDEFVCRIGELILSGKAQAASGVMLTPAGKSGVLATKYNRYAEDLWDCTFFLKYLFKRKQKTVTCGQGMVEAEFLYGSLFGINAAVFREIGGFDEKVFLYCEERILGTKMMRKGYRLLIDTDTSYVHHHSVSVDRSVSKIRQIETLFESTRYVYREYEQITGFQMRVLEIGMRYGVWIRKILYPVIYRG